MHLISRIFLSYPPLRPLRLRQLAFHCLSLYFPAMRRSPLNFTRLTGTVLGGTPVHREKQGRSILSQLMQEVAGQMQAFGCILWRAEDDGGTFSLMAGWFDVPEGEVIPLARFNGEGSCAGVALKQGTVIENSIGAENSNCDHPFLVKHGITRALGVRVSLNFDYGHRGVLLVYRHREDFPRPPHIPSQTDHESRTAAFSSGDLLCLQKLAAPALHLYEAATQQTALFLTRRVFQIFHKAPALPEASRLASILRQYGLAVQRAFGCLETSVFLEDAGTPGVYRCQFTTEGKHAPGTRKTERRPGLTEGYSGLALLSREAVRISDLKDDAADLERIRSDSRYTGFRGHAGLGVRKEVDRELLSDDRYPHSLLVMPLEIPGKVFGFVRCCVVRYGPAYFVHEDELLLKEAVRPFTRWLVRREEEWTSRQAGSREKSVLKEIARSARRKGKADQTVQGVLGQALKLASKLLPEAGLNSVRLVKDGYLSFDTIYVDESAPGASPYLSGWSSEGVFSRRDPTKNSKSYAKEALDSPGRVIEVSRANLNPDRYRKIVEGVEHLMIVAIHCAGKVRGVLDLRCFDPRGFPSHARPVALVIAGMLGLQLEIAEKSQALLDQERRVESGRLAAEQDKLARDREVTDAFLQVAHQLKGPLADARRYCERFQEPGAGRPTMQDIMALQVRIRRSEVVSKMVGVYASLARGESIRVRGKGMTPLEMAALLQAQITEAALGERAEKKSLRLDFDRDSILQKAPHRAGRGP